MAVADSTGLDVYLVASATATTTKAACATAIAAGKRIGKVKSNIDLNGSRSITEHKYISVDDSEKSIGSISYGNFTVDCPYDAADAIGQADLRAMFNGKTRRKMIIKDANGDYTTAPIICSSVKKTFAAEDFVMFGATIELDGPYLDVIV